MVRGCPANSDGRNSYPTLTVEFVAAASGHDVNNPTRRTAEFSLKSRGLDLNFLHKLERDVVVEVQGTGTEVGDFLTVNDKCVFRTRCSVNLKSTGKGSDEPPERCSASS